MAAKYKHCPIKHKPFLCRLKTMTKHSENFNQTLKQVSRSFYLSIRVLPKPMQKPVGIAYLLARAADSITDSDKIVREVRGQYLVNMLNLMSHQNLDETQNFSRKLAPLMSDPGEKKLMLCLAGVVNNYYLLETSDKTEVLSVVTTLIKGMQMDLAVFYQQDQITALKDQSSLEEYTYLVAGCVGEFWTKTAINHLPSLSHWQADTQTKMGIEFGKALQLTNILRDIAKDARLGRCYLPASALKEHQLTTKQLLDKQNDHLFRPIIDHQLTLALAYFKSAENYLMSTPRTEIRLRLASIWPILIGLKTLELIANKENFLDQNHTIKVKRNWVYRMLICSLFIVGSNTLLSLWIRRAATWKRII